MLIATANNVATILECYPEVLRAERFDATFMFDLPSLESRKSIWKYYMTKFGGSTVTGTCHELAIASVDWTGAEIRACCRLATMREVTVQEQMPLIPIISKLANGVITVARQTAIDKFVDASTGKLYKGPKTSGDDALSPRPRRKVNRDAN